MPTETPGTDWIATAKALVPLLEEEDGPSEELGTATPRAVEALRQAGMFALQLPRELGGYELDLGTYSDVLAELSYASGSLGWTVLANATNAGFPAVFLGDDAVKQMFGDGAVEVAAQLTPRGRITLADGGYRLTGSYGFGSGAGHAAWLGGGAMVFRDGAPEILPSGMPRMLGCYVPRASVTFQGGWDVMGLRGTGSFNYDITDALVPEDFTFEMITGAPRRGGAMYRLRLGILGTAGHSGWAIGAARRALDEAYAAAGRPLMRGQKPVGELEGYLTELGQLDAALRAARLLVLEEFERAQEWVEHNDAPTPELMVSVNQAITYSTRVAVDVVRKAFEWSGVAAIRTGVLERLFRDVHVAAQHITQTRASFANATQLVIAR